MALQLELGIKPVIKFSFVNYVVSEYNTQAVAHLKYILNHPEASYIYLWGGLSTGKSHLLRAVCEQASQNQLTSSYFSFDFLNSSSSKQNTLDMSSGTSSLTSPRTSPRTSPSISIDILDSLELYDVVCFDDIQCIAGHDDWEEAVFGFYNRIKDAQKILVIAGDRSVNSMPIKLPDLKSRLAWGVSYNIKPLSDDDKILLLQTNANERGMTLSDELAHYLIARGSRDLPGLFSILDKLDQASLRYKRKLTIPFAKTVLGL